MASFICKIASLQEMHEKWDYEIETHTGDSNWPIWKENAIIHAGTGQSIAYYGILDGRVICEASAALDASIVQNGEGLVDDLRAKGYERVTLGVEPCEIENMMRYFRYGFKEYVKMGKEIYPDGEQIDVIYYARQAGPLDYGGDAG